MNGTAVAFERVHLPKASEVIADRVRASILRGDLAEGAALPSEKDLMAQFGVSRATVREGMRMLEAEGLIAVRVGRGGGAMVSRPGARSHTRSLDTLLRFEGVGLAQILEARRAIEPLCGRLAAERATPDQLAQLRARRDRVAASVHEPSINLAAQCDMHLLIAEASGNPVLQIYASSLAELALPRIQEVPFTVDELKTGAASCARIVTAIESNDPDAAERRIRRHLTAVEAIAARERVEPQRTQRAQRVGA